MLSSVRRHPPPLSTPIASTFSLPSLPKSELINAVRVYTLICVTAPAHAWDVQAAADLYLSVDMVKESIDCCIEARLWDKARATVLEDGQDYDKYVEAKYVEFLKSGDSGEAAERLVDVDVIAGLDMMAERGEWDRVLDRAQEQGGQVLNKYVHACTHVRLHACVHAPGKLEAGFAASVAAYSFPLCV